MRLIGRLTPAKTAAVVTVGVVAAVALARGQSMFSPGPLNAESRRSEPVGGARSHAEFASNCSACHAEPWSSTTMAERCLDCHIEVKQQMASGKAMHAKMAAEKDCRTCHTEHRGAHAAITEMSQFHHNEWTAFALTGKHLSTDCKACHTGSVFAGTPQTCAGCHAEPAVHKDRYGGACAECHSTVSWQWTWSGLAHFDHNMSSFKLTGQHAKVECQACHVGNTFRSTPQTCAACHAEPPVHMGRFSANCTECHTTASWTGAYFKHSVFNINHHNRTGTGTCAKCHNDQANFVGYTCYNCHEHQPERIKTIHLKRNIVNYQECVDCHSPLKKRKTADAGPFEERPALVQFLDDDACPVGCPAAGDGTGLRLPAPAVSFPNLLPREKARVSQQALPAKAAPGVLPLGREPFHPASLLEPLDANRLLFRKV
jgi:hypothetical protein